MADTGWVLCTAAQDLADGNGSVSWSSVTNITSSNDVYAAWTSGSSKNTDTIKAHTFGIGLPSGSTVNGIETRVEAKESGTVVIAGVNIGKSDAALGTAKTPGDALTSSDVNYDHGGAADLWGLSITEAEVEAATFQIRYVFGLTGASTVQVDAVWVKVHYTEAANSTAGEASGSGAASGAAVAAVGAAANLGGTSSLVAAAASIANAVASAAGSGDVAAEGEGEPGVVRALCAGSGDLTGAGASVAASVFSISGSGSALGATPVAESVTYPPVGGGGGFGPATFDPGRQQFRKRREKSKPRVITVRIGEWPEDPQIILERRERADRDEFYRSFANAPIEQIVESSDDEEEILLQILAMAA